MLRTTWKAFQLATLILKHFAYGLYAFSMFDDEHDRRDFLIRMLSRSSREALKILGIQVTLSDPLQSLNQSSNYVLASNHLSYLDVMVISAFMPAAFVTSMEVRETPFLGKVCLYGGSFFVERRRSHQVRRELRDLKRNLKQGLNIVIFPEATSTDGSSLRPFKRGLLAAAKHSQVPVLPLCLNYRRVNGEDVNKTSRDVIFYYGEMKFFPHLMRLLASRSIEVELKILESIPCQQPLDADFEPTSIAFERVYSAYVPIGAV